MEAKKIDLKIETEVTNKERFQEILLSSVFVLFLILCLYDIWPQDLTQWFHRIFGVLVLTVCLCMEIRSVYYCDEDILHRKNAKLLTDYLNNKSKDSNVNE